jgi:hypothetical protein
MHLSSSQFAAISDRYFLQLGSMQVEPENTGLRQGIFFVFRQSAFSATTAIHADLVSDLVSVALELPNAMLR